MASVDGHNFSCGFDKKGWADTFAEKLREHFLAGYLFDPEARSFMLPNEAGDTGPAVFAFVAEDVRRRWTSWEPSARRNFPRDLVRAVLHLVDPDAPALDGSQRVEADDYLRRVALMVPASAATSETDTQWEAWFTRWSLPLAAVTDGHLQNFLEAVRTTKIDGSPRVLAPTTVAAARTPVRAAFRSAHKRRLIDWNPWDGVEWEVPTGEEDLRAELVMDPRQVLHVSAARGAVDPRYECFVLIQGACGLRLGEAREVRRRDVDVRSTPATVTVRGQYSELPERFFAEGATRQRPLKGRGRRTTRKIPIPAPLVPRFAAHMEQFVERKPEALVFTTPTGRRIHTSNFHRSVWKTAREKVFEDGNPLREVRRHDLRHSAITAWLNSGVLLKTAQKWSGHRTASVLLNTYLGVMRDDAAVSLARAEAAFADRPRSVAELEKKSETRRQPVVKSENRHGLAFPLVKSKKLVNGKADPGWARQGSNLRPTTYEEPTSHDSLIGQISGLNCRFTECPRLTDRAVAGLRRGLVAEVEPSWWGDRDAAEERRALIAAFRVEDLEAATAVLRWRCVRLEHSRSCGEVVTVGEVAEVLLGQWSVAFHTRLADSQRAFFAVADPGRLTHAAEDGRAVAVAVRDFYLAPGRISGRSLQQALNLANTDASRLRLDRAG